MDLPALDAAVRAVCPIVRLALDGSPVFDPSATADQRAAAQQLVAGWFPLPPPVSGDLIVGALSKAQAALCDVRDLARIAWRDDVPASNAKLVRIAKAAGTTPDALRAAAQGG